MELSLSRSHSLEFSPLRPHHNASSQKQKTTIKPMGRYTCLSAKFSHSPQAIKLQSHVSYSKFWPNKSPGYKAVPLIRAYTQGGGDKFADSAPFTKLMNFSHLVLRLMRGYIVRGSVIAFSAVTARMWIENAHLVKLSKWSLLLRALAALISLVCMDGFIGGINDIFDIEIDKINKPYYPIASGDLSVQSAWLLVISFAGIGLLMIGLLHSLPFLLCLCLAFTLGVIYSVPPFRTKRSTTGAILTCAVGRGCLFPLVMLAAARATLGLPFQWSASITFITIFFTASYLSIGAMKDISDVEGDKMGDVPTLVSIIGASRVAAMGFGLLLMTYVGSIFTAICMPQIFRPSVMIPLHVILALCFLFQAWKLHKSNYSKEESLAFCRVMLMLFDAEYILFPFI